jgi:tRNA(Ile)-lysidine synthase
MHDCTLESSVSKFLNQHCNFKKPVLLGLSGGPDSVALFHLLIKCQQIKPFVLGIAHVDHGWREESGREALALEKIAQEFGANFHLIKLNPKELEGNLEAACRHKRLHFFSDLCKNYHYQAVLLAHHADDQIETVLKKVFEGVHLTNLQGLKEITLMRDLQIWRPLLRFRKKEILEWINTKQLNAFHDDTNDDPRYLRARMRRNILPYLTKEFGKKMDLSILKLAEDSQELSDYLESKLGLELSKIVKSPRGLLLDLSEKKLPIFEIKYLIKKICEMDNFYLSRNGIQQCAQHIQNKAGNKKIEMGPKTIHIDRGCLFIETFSPSFPVEFLSLDLGTHLYGDWEVNVSYCHLESRSRQSNWKDVWLGKCEVRLPKCQYQLGQVKLNYKYPNSSFVSEWWTKTKVPAFLRFSVPLIWNLDRNNIESEFLSGRGKSYQLETNEWIKISLKLCHTSIQNN